MNETNLEMQMAYDYLETTNTVVFLTGKAGTGKTTFLQNLRQTSKKKLAVLAPTGVAALNAGGMTIHSFFQLGFGPIIPSGKARQDVYYSDEKRTLLDSLELLVIDEVSMVRPDILDQIDLILRTTKDSSHPFGGVQLLLIGDLSQLSPIIREEEWAMLNRYYATPYFFSSLVMQKTPYVRIELSHVFRQKEQEFVDILNEVRNQVISTSSLELLNARYQPDFRPSAEDPYITLTTHNGIAQQINNEYIEALPGIAYEFSATISGDFPKDAYPTESQLTLKVGAQVMFVKNDSSAEKLYYNGKIGTVSDIKDKTVFVKCGVEAKEIEVEALQWTNIKYQLDGEAINETNAGSFSQMPLKLAWAITIHKSQGLSFDKAIIDVSEAFTHGQAYVALSRCRTFSGMVLRNPITVNTIIGDPAVARFNETARALEPNRAKLESDQEHYRLFLLSELVNFLPLQSRLHDFEGLFPDFKKEILDVAEKFSKQLNPERSQPAATYFLAKLTAILENLHKQLPAYIDQSKDRAQKADQLITWILHRIRMLEYFSANPFTTPAYISLIKDKILLHGHSYLKALNAKPNEKLFEQLISWRNKKAETEKVLPSMIFSEKTLATIAEKLPATLKALSGIKGVGPPKATQYGAELILLIRAYEQEIKGTAPEQSSLF